jgi:ABC-type antimicrobial peptide transport system permease subunit
MPGILQDLRYALRLLARAPGFTAVAATVLALGIGANSAIFSVVDAALLRPLPWAKPPELTMLWEHPPGYRTDRVSPLNFQDWHDQNTVFAGLAAIAGGSPTLQTPSGPEQIPGQAVTSEFFNLLGIVPLAGRTFTAEDDRQQASVVMLGENLWRSHFSADPNIAGRSVTLSGKPFVVAGVVPAGFQFLFPADIWTLFTVKRSPEQRRMHYLQVVGRLKPGVSMQQAESAMDGIARHIAQVAPGTNKGWGVTVEPLRQALVGNELRATSLMLAGVVAFVLLMACANVANLMLARGAGRAREMAVRVSLGAPVIRLMRQLLTESLLLAALGGIGGLALAWALIRAAPSLIPAGTLPAGLSLALDARIAAFTIVVTLATGLLFGVVPAWKTARGSLAGANYFQTLGIPLQAGRAFDGRDNRAAPQVAIVNQEFVRRYLPGRPVLGTHIRVQAMEMAGPKPVEREIVGVAGQVKVNGPGEEENAVEIYVPVTQNPWFGPSLAVRTAGEPLAMAAAVKNAIARVDKELAVTQVRTMDEIAFQSVARPRFRAELLAGLAGLALLLSAVGVFGVLAFAVAQRKREFGIRMALGAQMADVLGLVLTRGAAIAAGGVATGLLGAAALARSLTALLFGVQPLDPLTFLATAAILGLVAVAAAAIPAFRAARVDPAIALREE